MDSHAFYTYLTTRATPKPVGANSAEQYVKQVRRWLSWVTETGDDDPVSYVEQNRGRVSSSATALAIYGIRHYYKFLGKRDPLRGTRVRRRPANRPADAFTMEEVVALYAACWNARDRALFLTLLDTGVRASELCRIKPSDIDWKEKTVTIFGKGEKWRKVPLSDRTIQALKSYYATEDSKWGTGHLSYSWLAHWFQDLCAKAGLHGPMHLHRMRTTAADHWIEAGIPLDLVMTLMGHSDIATTMHYTRKNRDTRALNAARAMMVADRLLSA